MHEAQRLQDDLRRAGISPHAWIINQSLFASGTHDPLLRLGGGYEVAFIQRATAESAKNTVLVPWFAEAPVGQQGLSKVVA